MKELLNEGAQVIKHANTLLKSMVKTFEREIGKVEVKFTEGRMLKIVRPIVAQQLRVLADLVENPNKAIKLLELKKPETKPKTKKK